MELHNLEYKKGSRGHKVKTYGRGHGSGIGKTSGKGQDGQKSRKSGGTRLGFEGGQTPLYRRVPKVGFNNYRFANNYNVITIEMINALKLTNVTPEILIEKRLVANKNLPVKVIGNGKLDVEVTIKAHKFSKGAIAAIESAKGKYEVI